MFWAGTAGIVSLILNVLIINYILSFPSEVAYISSTACSTTGAVKGERTKVMVRQSDFKGIYIFLFLLSNGNSETLLVIQDNLVSKDCRVMQFKHPAVMNRILVGHVITSVQVKSEIGCEANCFEHDDCMSVNLGPLQDGKHLCELSSSDHDIHPEDLKHQEEFIYKPVWNYCANNSCPSGNRCQTGFTGERFRCVASNEEIDCGANWYRYKTASCVRLFTAMKTREEANILCRSFQTSNKVQGNLVTIMSQEDNDRLVSLSTQSGKYFIGLNDFMTEGVFQWPGGLAPAYFNWASGFPQNSDCTVLLIKHGSKRGKWMTRRCQNNKQHFICECAGACS